ncbi:MAG: HD domain-containing protein [Nitrososphaerales archaeon]
MDERRVVIDPIHSRIELPVWITKLAAEKPSVRRMMQIRQLGLKAYLDFPGAIHTRYSHALGSMHLASKITSMLSEREKRRNKLTVSEILKDYQINIAAAGFLHDIAHGPFSHAIDFVLEKNLKKTHEQIAREVICDELKDLEKFGISTKSVADIIDGSHEFGFVSQIINGPLDVDKLDYLLRDSYHVGLKYSFDLDYFINGYSVLGNDEFPEECELGLQDVPETVTTAEVFVLIWRSMYDLVYHIENSRIAEKMLEKALILECQDNSDIKEYFKSIQKYIQLNDELLLQLLLERGSNFSKQIVEAIFKKGTVFKTTYTTDLKQLSARKIVDERFMDALIGESKEEEISDKMSLKVCEKLGVDKYDIIVDIIKGKVPETIHIDRPIDLKKGEPPELADESDIIKYMEPRIKLKAYVNGVTHKKLGTETINMKVEEVLSSWQE